MHGTDHRVGQPREGLARLPRRHRAGENAHADQEHVFQPEHADALEQILVVARLRQRGVEPARKLGVVRQRAEETRVDQRVHHLRIARQRVGEPRRDAEHQRDQRDQLGVLPQQRQQPRRARADWRENDRTQQRGVRDCRCARSVPAAPAAAPANGRARLRPSASDARRQASCARWPRLPAARGSRVRPAGRASCGRRPRAGKFSAGRSAAGAVSNRRA